MTKVCPRCGIAKDHSDFYKGTTKFNLSSTCKICALAYRKYLRETYPERVKEIKKRSYEKNRPPYKMRRQFDSNGLLECPGCHVSKHLSDYSKRGNGRPLSLCKSCKKESAFRSERGITFCERESLRKVFAGCWLCGKTNNCQLVIDHDHSHEWKHPMPPGAKAKGTRRSCKECIRGLLCQPCNRSVIPVMERCPDLVSHRTAQYLALRPFLYSSLCEQFVAKFRNENRETEHEKSKNVERPYKLESQSLER
jgi:hypothetical protein